MRRLPARRLVLCSVSLALAAAASAVASSPDRPTGPLVAAADYQQNYQHTMGVQLETALLVFDAAAQTAGLIMAIVGGAIHARSKRAANVSWAGTGVRGTF